MNLTGSPFESWESELMPEDNRAIAAIPVIKAAVMQNTTADPPDESGRKVTAHQIR
jgi:hypothetical protein